MFDLITDFPLRSHKQESSKVVNHSSPKFLLQVQSVNSSSTIQVRAIRAHCAHFFVHDNTELKDKKVLKSPYFNWEGLSGKGRRHYWVGV